MLKSLDEAPRKSSLPTDSESGSSKEPDGKGHVTLSAKRRSTMNSRAAYEEEETLQRVLEASKTEGPTSGGRKTKRSREESVE
ncbi:hypothetical protein MRB53_037621 [Persea americana]|nr:hypothetical protein MRB53_037621 [Persea americana]